MAMTSGLSGLIRTWLKDKEKKNRLKGHAFEFDDGDILSAAQLAVSKINFLYPPETAYTIDDCPEYILILGTVEQMLTSEIALKARNYIDAVVGGSRVNREGNITIYQAILSQVKTDFDEALRFMKLKINIEAGFSA